MKLFFKNSDFLKNNKSYHVKRESKIGNSIIPIVVASSLALSSSIANLSSPTIHNNTPSVVIPSNIHMDSNDINELNIILNNDNCNNDFFQEVCDHLKEDGIVFQVTNKGNDINHINSTVITLDQDYSEGNDTIVFAPYNNTRIGQSDSLALSMYSAFDQNGFILGNILCSKIGYNDNKEVDFNLPTDTEKAIDEDCDTSFVTISFGSNNVNAEWVAKSIENGLARQKYYLDYYDNKMDLIYRASKEDFIDTVADYFGTTSNKLQSFNKMKDSNFNDSQAIINPSVEYYTVFNRDKIFEINGVKTRAY